MKKLLSLFTVCLLVMGMAALPVSAATPKDTIVDTIKADMPDAYADLYIPLVENVLQQITVTEEQAAVVVNCIKACKDIITDDKGPSLHSYTEEQRRIVSEQFGLACDALNLKYEIKMSSTPVHDGDLICVVYNAAGKKLADIDGDVVKKTNTANEVNYDFAAMAVILLAGAVVAVIYGKKAVASR